MTRDNKKLVVANRRFASLWGRILALIVLCALFLGIYSYTRARVSQTAYAATGINRQINFQGKLTNTNGTNVTNGSYSIVFSIYSVSSGGVAIWTETQTPTVTDGIFQVNLGSVTALPGSVDFNTDNIYLGIKVGADAEMTPRVQFTAVPQAFNSEKLGGLDKTAFALASGANYIAKNTNDTSTSSFLGNLLGFTNSNAGAAGVLSLTNAGTNSALSVTTTANPTAGQAVIFASNTNAAPTGNLLDLQSGSSPTSKFSVDANGNLVASGTIDGASLSGGTLSGGTVSGGSLSASAVNGLSVSGGTITVGVWNGTALLDAAVSNTLTIDNTGTVDWLALNNYPASATCAGGSAVTVIADAVTCAAFNTDTSITLQDAYDDGNTITTTDAKSISFTLADTATDSSFIVNANCATCSASGGQIRLQDGGVDRVVVDPGGSLTLTAGAASTWSTTAGNLTIQAATTNTLTLDTAGAGTVNIGTNASTVTLGAGVGAETVNIGTAGGNDVVNILTGTGTNTLNIGNSTTTTYVQGNVGIGASDPDLRLTVVAPNATTNQINLRSARAAIVNTNIIGGLSFTSDDTSLTAPGILTASIQAVATATHTAAVLDTALVFSTASGTTLSEAVRITGNNRVGIGSTAPTAILHVTAVQQPLVSVASGTVATQILNVTGGIGGNTDIATTGTGGAGGLLGLTGGAGGQATAAAVLSTGGAGGALTFNGGAGGIASVAGTGNNTGGIGGAFSWVAGAGGAANGVTSGNNTGGNGGGITLQGGTGGSATLGSGLLVGGTGGALTLAGGTGGVGATSGGNGGAVVLQGGVAAAMEGAAGGAASLFGRAGSVTGTGGAGGGVTITGGLAGGDNTVNRAGGAVTLTAGAAKGPTQAGAAISLIAGAGGQNLAVGTATGPNGGGFVITLSAGGTAPNADISSVSGAGGTFTINGGAGGIANVAGTGNNRGGAGSQLTWTAGAGGASTGATSGTNTGGNGGAIVTASGAGGAATGAGTGNGLGGNGGAFNLTGGSGGASTLGGVVDNTGGVGAVLTWAGGTGGAANGATSGINTGGSGGAVTLRAGNGGAATIGTGTLQGGNGASLTLAGGVGGAGATAAGTGGDIVLQTAPTTALVERIRITNSGLVGIGTSTTTSLPDARLTVVAADVTSNQIRLRSLRAAIVSGNVIGGIDFMSNDTNLTAPGLVTAGIQALASATHSAAALDTDLVFSTTDALVTAERWRITDTGILQSIGAQTIQSSSGDLSIRANGTSILNLDTTGAGTINIGTNATTITLGGGSANRTINIGDSSGTSTVNIINDTGTDTLNIATDTGTANTVNIGHATTSNTAVNIRPNTAGVNISGRNSQAAGTVYGININNLTAGAAAETAINLGTGWDSLLSYNSTSLINGSGILQSAAVSGSYTGITGTGALNAGSITSGFGNINIGASTFTTTGAVAAGDTSITGTLGVSGAISGSSTIQGTRLISTIASGTAPLTVTSTTLVTNLNADLLDGLDSTAFAPISGGSGYVQLQSTTPGTAQTGHLNITGTGIIPTIRFGGSRGELSGGGTGDPTIQMLTGASWFNIRNIAGTDVVRVLDNGNITATGTINSQTISSTANFTGTLGVATSITSPFYNVTAATGNGICFWQDCSNYKLHMGTGAEYAYGPVTGYSIKSNMNNDSTRGWTWGVTGVAPVAAINTQGNMQLAGNLVAMGNLGVGIAPTQKLHVNGTTKLDGAIIEGTSTYKVHRNVATYNASVSGSAGAFVIQTPVPLTANTMTKTTIEGYFYDSTAPFKIEVSGYWYNGTSFINTGYVNVGANKLSVRFAKHTATGNVAIILGSEGSTYEYPKLTITSFQQGHASINDAYATGWTISQQTSLAAYDTVTAVADKTSIPASQVTAGTFGTGAFVFQGAVSGVTSLTLSGAISGGTSYSGSGNINTTAGAFQLNGVDINTAGTLTNVAYENQANNFTQANTFSAGGTALSVTNNATIGGKLQMGATAPVSDALISAIAADNAIEFGHSNAGGYRSTLGTELSSGASFLAFNAEAATNIANNYRTRGISGAVLKSNLAGGFLFGNIPTANADDQAFVQTASLTSAGTLTVASDLVASGGDLTLTGTSTITAGGSQATYGGLSINGTKGGYSGLNFRSGATNYGTLMVHPDYQGFFNDADNGWDWYFNNGTMVAGTIPAANVAAGTFGAGDFAFQNNLSGKTLTAYNGASNDQIYLGYSTTTNYRHAIKTQHDGGAAVNNQISFNLWTPVDASSAVGTLVVGRFDGAGRFSLPVAGSSAGLMIGGDALLYRSAASTLTGTNLNATNGINTGAAAGTQRIDVSGNLVNIGNISGSGAITVTPSAGNNLNIALSGAGDLAVNTNQLYVDTSAGNVGIGTASPQAKLHVVGGTYLQGNLGTNGLSGVQSQAGNFNLAPNSSFEIKTNTSGGLTGNPDGWILTAAPGSGTAATTRESDSQADSTYAVKSVLTGAGVSYSVITMNSYIPVKPSTSYYHAIDARHDVTANNCTTGLYVRTHWFTSALAATSPAYLDSVANGATTTTWTTYGASVTSPSNATFARLEYYSFLPPGSCTRWYDNAVFRQVDFNGPVNFAVNTGNVGIGTSSPGGKLHVTKDNSNDELVIGDDILDFAFPATTSLHLGNTSDNSAIRIGQSSTAWGALAWKYNATASSAALALTSTGTNNLLLQDPALNANGNVGIGAAVPTAKLHVEQASVTTATVSAINVLNVTGGQGGSAGAGQLGGFGGGASLWSGKGGNATAATGTPGSGGTLFLRGGDGGNGTSTSANGHGGYVILQGGSPGTGGSGAAGSFGTVYIQDSGGATLIGTSNASGEGADVLQVKGGNDSIYLKTGAISDSMNMLLSLTSNATASKDFGIGGYSLGQIGNFNVYANNTNVQGSLTVNNSGYVSITGAADGSGNLRFTAANPYIVSSSYAIMPGGAYFNAGTVYAEAQIQARGGIADDGGVLEINDDINMGNGDLYVENSSGEIGIGNTSPGSALEVTGNITLTKEANRTIGVGNSTTTNAAGGQLTISSGNGNGSGTGGQINILAGTSSSGGGGPIVVTAGLSTSGAGGNINITAGQSVTSTGGTVIINGGLGTGAVYQNVHLASLGGAVGIGGGPAANMKLDVNGRVQIDLAGAQTTAALCGTQGNGGGAAVANVEIVDCNGVPAADYMEMYSVEPGIETGEIVAPSITMITTKDGDTIAKLTKSSSAYQKNVIGIVSDKSKAGDFNSIGYNIKEEDNPQPVALNGRVYIKIAADSSAIMPGDYITASATPGKGMKATKAGQMVGKALEAWAPNTGKDTVMIFVTTSYADPIDHSIQGQAGHGEYASLNISGAATVGNLTVTGITTTQDLVVTGSATLANLNVANIVTTQNLLVTQVATVETLKVAQSAEFGGDIKLIGVGNTRNAITKRFKASKAIEVGSVVIADPENDGQVTTTDNRADRKVIGVVVTAAVHPGDEIEVAIGGSLQVRFDTAIVTAGDLVISSDKEGAATVADEEPKIGTVLGKATSKKDAQGFVWILVTLL